VPEFVEDEPWEARRGHLGLEVAFSQVVRLHPGPPDGNTRTLPPFLKSSGPSISRWAKKAALASRCRAADLLRRTFLGGLNTSRWGSRVLLALREPGSAWRSRSFHQRPIQIPGGALRAVRDGLVFRRVLDVRGLAGGSSGGEGFRAVVYLFTATTVSTNRIRRWTSGTPRGVGGPFMQASEYELPRTALLRTPVRERGGITQ
jgi:hypothetical protein